jgi:hypothetical protein
MLSLLAVGMSVIKFLVSPLALLSPQKKSGRPAGCGVYLLLDKFGGGKGHSIYHKFLPNNITLKIS